MWTVAHAREGGSSMHASKALEQHKCSTQGVVEAPNHGLHHAVRDRHISAQAQRLALAGAAPIVVASWNSWLRKPRISGGAISLRNSGTACRQRYSGFRD